MKKDEQVICSLSDLNPIWATLTEEQCEETTALIEVVRFHKNDVIHREGDTPTHIMMLVSGKAKIYKEGIGQRQQTIRLLKAGDLFSCRAIIANDCYVNCASALEDSVVYQLPRQHFLDLLQSNHAFCLAITQSFAKHLAVSETQVVHLTQKHIRGRLAEALLTVKTLYGVNEDGVTIASYISREDFANMSNMTTNNAIRTLSQFAQEGLVELNKRQIKILQEDTLQKISRLG